MAYSNEIYVHFVHIFRDVFEMMFFFYYHLFHFYVPLRVDLQFSVGHFIFIRTRRGRSLRRRRLRIPGICWRIGPLLSGHGQSTQCKGKEREAVIKKTTKNKKEGVGCGVLCFLSFCFLFLFLAYFFEKKQ